jgi:hypothetical protein
MKTTVSISHISTDIVTEVSHGKVLNLGGVVGIALTINSLNASFRIIAVEAVHCLYVRIA